MVRAVSPTQESKRLRKLGLLFDLTRCLRHLTSIKFDALVESYNIPLPAANSYILTE